MLGLWMLETRCSPRPVSSISSLAVLPSEPGAPLGQRGISLGTSAAKVAPAQTTVATTAGSTLRGGVMVRRILWEWPCKRIQFNLERPDPRIRQTTGDGDYAISSCTTRPC